MYILSKQFSDKFNKLYKKNKKSKMSVFLSKDIGVDL